jgi:hypothetical protein
VRVCAQFFSITGARKLKFGQVGVLLVVMGYTGAENKK